MTPTKKSGAKPGNQNAKKTECRKMVSFRLPVELITKLDQLENKTAVIEAAVRAYLA